MRMKEDVQQYYEAFYLEEYRTARRLRKQIKESEADGRKGLKKLGKQFRKGAEIVDEMAELLEKEDMTVEEKEEALKEKQAEFLIQMILLQSAAGEI